MLLHSLLHLPLFQAPSVIADVAIVGELSALGLLNVMGIFVGGGMAGYVSVLQQRSKVSGPDDDASRCLLPEVLCVWVRH